MNTIIGIHLGHDASVSVLYDGQPVFCLSEERLAREKMYFGFPFRALEAALNHFSIAPEDADVVALDTLELPRLLGPDEMACRFSRGIERNAAKRLLKAKKLFSYLFRRSRRARPQAREHQAGRILRQGLQSLGLRPERVRVYDHHLSHAASAFFPSPFPEALFVTSDGRGDGLSATLGVAAGWTIVRRLAIADEHSIGQFYAAATCFLGFRPNRHEGKIMGLAAHGDPLRLGPRFLGQVAWLPNGAYEFQIPGRYRLRSADELSQFARAMNLPLKQRVALDGHGDPHSLLYHSNWHGLLAYLHEVARHAPPEDVAAGGQFLAESVAVEFVKRNLPNSKSPVVLAGGLFSNVRVNQKIRELPGVSQIYVQPAMGDEGLSLGAALLAHAEGLVAGPRAAGALRSSSIGHTCLGPSYSSSEVRSLCRHAGVEPLEVENLERHVAAWIHQGLVIGYFRGRLEYGPRALGHRSILARATDPSVPDALNRRLRRTEFMPFAPSVLAEHASEYFVDFDPGDPSARYMTSTYEVRAARRSQVPAVVHVDGTARPHAVHAAEDPQFHRLLDEYRRLSGVPLVINTSFNLHEEPIVCRPQDALQAYQRGCVDVLVMDGWVIGRTAADLRDDVKASRAVAATHR